jgi:hypothetical protein
VACYTLSSLWISFELREPEAAMNNILEKLRGGDRRSIGRSNEIAREISSNPKLFAQVVAAMLDANPVVRMRARGRKLLPIFANR